MITAAEFLLGAALMAVAYRGLTSRWPWQP
jgi:hypothetical protein